MATKRIADAGCCCGCPCCTAPKGTGGWKATFAGVVNGVNCLKCNAWNTTWELSSSSAADDVCIWTAERDLGCDLIEIELAILCPAPSFGGVPVPAPNVYYEFGVSENGEFVGEWRGLWLLQLQFPPGLIPNGGNAVDCRDVTLNDWYVSAHLPNPDRCDFTNARVRIFQ